MNFVALNLISNNKYVFLNRIESVDLVESRPTFELEWRRAFEERREGGSNIFSRSPKYTHFIPAVWCFGV